MAEKTKTIEIEESKLNEILARMERLEAAASKARLHNFDEKTKKPNGKTVNLRVLDGRVVISWGNLVKNIVEKNTSGVWGEDQQVKLTFEDGKTEIMPYVVFTRRYVFLPAEVKKEIKDEDGNITFSVETAEEKKYEISDKFVN